MRNLGRKLGRKGCESPSLLHSAFHRFASAAVLLVNRPGVSVKASVTA